MSIMRTSLNALATSIAATHGEPITYLSRDKDSAVTATTAIALASVLPLREGTWEDIDGRMQAGSIMVNFPKTELAAVQVNDIVTWGGADWVVKEIESPNARHQVLAVREHRRERGHAGSRRDRRNFTGGGR